MRAFAVVAFTLISLCMSSTAQAPRAVFTASSASDKADAAPGDGFCVATNGKCTLRAAIMENNALGGGSTINLSAATYSLTRDAADETGGDLDITAPVTIVGLGPGLTIIDAGALPTADRVFHVNAPAGLTTLTGVTIQNGEHPNNGGGIFFETTGELTDVVLTDNSAEEGGGLSCLSCVSITASGLVVKNNTAGLAGGGLYVAGAEFNGIQLTISANTASTSTGGGAVFFGSNVYLAEASITGNSAGQDGGGMNVGTSIFVTEDLLISHNTAGNMGGGLRIDSSNYALQAALVSYNTTTGYGGGVAISESTGGISKVSLIHNRADLGGGGAYAGNTAFIVANSTFSGNQSAKGGAIMFSQGPSSTYASVFSNVTIVENTLLTANPAEADGIDATFLGLGSLALNNTILTGNGARQCLGALTSTDGNIFANTTDCTISTQSGDQTSVTDAMLSPLVPDAHRNYAVVHIPLSGSPALNAGANGNCRDEDQRSVDRPHGPGDPCDVGAVEGGQLSLLVNGSLEDGNLDGKPDNWTLNDASKDKLKCVVPGDIPALVGDCAMRFKDPTGTMVQKVTLAVPFDGVFEFGAFIDSGTTTLNAVIKLKIMDGAGVVLSTTNLDVDEATVGYKRLSASTPLSSGVASAKVIVRYPKDSGKLYIDGLWLYANANPARGRAPLPLPPLPLGFRGSN